MRKINRVERTIALISPVGLGVCAAVFAIVDQSGYTRGYDSVGFLFISAWLALGLVIAGIVILSQGKQLQNAVPIAVLMFVGAFTLPASFLFVLFIVRKYYGE